jgi:hypothetical protein
MGPDVGYCNFDPNYTALGFGAAQAIMHENLGRSDPVTMQKTSNY